MAQRKESFDALLLALFHPQIGSEKLRTFFVAENDTVRDALPLVELLFLVRLGLYLDDNYGIALRIEEPSQLLLLEYSLTLSNEAIQLSPLENVPYHKAHQHEARYLD